MADLGLLTAPRRTVEIKGQQWVFTPLTLQDQEELLLVMADKWPKPVATAKQHLDGLNDAERLEILRMAFSYELRPKLPSADEFELWKRGPFGGPRAWHRMLLPANSTITLEEAWILWDSADETAHRKVWGVEDIHLGNSSGPAETGPPTQE